MRSRCSSKRSRNSLMRSSAMRSKLWNRQKNSWKTIKTCLSILRLSKIKSKESKDIKKRLPTWSKRTKMSATPSKTRKLTLTRSSTSGLKRLMNRKLRSNQSLSRNKRLIAQFLTSIKLQLPKLSLAQSLKLSQLLRRKLRRMPNSTFNLSKSSLSTLADLRKSRIAQTWLRLRATSTFLLTLSTFQIVLNSLTRSPWWNSMLQPMIKSLWSSLTRLIQTILLNLQLTRLRKRSLLFKFLRTPLMNLT